MKMLSKTPFKKFWEAYGLKRNRVNAEYAWDCLPETDRRAAIAGIAAYREQCMRSGVRMAYGQRYLNKRYWENGPATGLYATMPTDRKEEDMLIF